MATPPKAMSVLTKHDKGMNNKQQLRLYIYTFPINTNTFTALSLLLLFFFSLSSSPFVLTTIHFQQNSLSSPEPIN